MHFKNNIKHRRFHIQGLRSFKDTLPKNIKKILNKKGHIYADILNKWNYLVGKNIAEIAYPKSFKPGPKNEPGMLIVKIKRGSEIEIEYSKNQIVNKINSYFGYKAIDKIRLEPFQIQNSERKNYKLPVTEKQKNKYLHLLKNIKNDKLRKSLLNLTINFKI